jgi:succinate dehydrogenase / fumarate reductase cytochrome b subunit
LLWRQNRSARPVKYAVTDAKENSRWYSRSMGVLGSLLLIFLAVHISNFFVGTKVALYAHGDAPHNLYEEMREKFSNLWLVLFYLAGVFSLFWHLLHGFGSAFQTLGINHKRYTPIIRSAGRLYTYAICILFALMPLAFHFKWIG